MPKKSLEEIFGSTPTAVTQNAPIPPQRKSLDEIFGNGTSVPSPAPNTPPASGVPQRKSLDEIFGSNAAPATPPDATVTPVKSLPMRALDTMKQGYADNFERTKGSIKEALSLGSRLGSLGTNIGGAISNGVDSLRGVRRSPTSPESPAAQALRLGVERPQTLTPNNDLQKQGATVENVAEFLVPNPFKLAKLPKATGIAGKALNFGTRVLLAKLPKATGIAGKALNFGTRVLGEGVEQGARSAIQKGSGKDLGTDAAIGAAFPVAGAVLKGAGRIAGETLGLTTGTGYGAIRQAFRDNSPEFKKALRGNVDDTMTEVLGSAKDALDVVKNNRQTKYLAELNQIKDTAVPINFEELKTKAVNNLKNYGVKIQKDGNLDFSRSSIADKAEVDRLRGILDTVFDWGSQEGDNAVVGLDTLKRRLDDFYSPSSQVRSYVAGLRRDVANTIKKAVPKYDEMTKGYQDTTRLIKDIESGLSVGDKAKPDTAIRKLTSVLRENNEHRRELLAALEEASGGQNMAGKIAGAQMSALLPRGWGSKIVSTIGGAGAVAINPLALIPGLALASPRVVAEFTSVLGRAYRQAAKEGVQSTLKGAAAQINK